MDNAHVCVDWLISDIDRFDLDIEILRPTPERLDKGLVFWQWYFSFKGVGGYIGFQLTESGKKAIFSIWQPINGCGGKLSEECGEPVYKCLHDYPWELNQKYRLTVKIDKEENDGLWWIGEIFDYKKDTLTTIGKILISKSFEKLKGYNYYTCLETGYFKDDNIIPDIKAKISNNLAYINDEKYDLKEKLKKFTVFMTDKSKKSKVVINNDLSYILEAGGQVVRARGM